MKHLLILLSFSSTALFACGQADKRDSIANSVAAYVQSAGQAANIFLNRQLPDDQRLKAIAPYSQVYDEGQIRLFKATVLDGDQSPAIRAMALNKIYQQVDADENLFAQVVGWFANPRTPQPLRDETLSLIGNLSFSSVPRVLDVYHQMVQDPDPRYRSFVLSKLLLNGDARAQQLLIRGLQDPEAALVPPVQAIELLSYAPKPEYYPAVFKLLQETKEDSVRLAAVQALGAYRPARERLTAISRDAAAGEAFRISALMALYSGDRENIVGYVTPILQDGRAPLALHMLALQMTLDVRKKMAYRRNAKRADAYDLLVRNIAEGKGVSQAPELRDLANKYLLQVRPQF